MLSLTCFKCLIKAHNAKAAFIIPHRSEIKYFRTIMRRGVINATCEERRFDNNRKQIQFIQQYMIKKLFLPEYFWALNPHFWVLTGVSGSH